jgi:hypothetical protein
MTTPGMRDSYLRSTPMYQTRTSTIHLSAVSSQTEVDQRIEDGWMFRKVVTLCKCDADEVPAVFRGGSW